jgi:hypothetical protein
MARYKDTVPSSRSQEATFDYLARFSNTDEWDPGAQEGRDLQQGGPIGVGSRFSLDFKIAGLTTELVYEITEYERPSRVRLVARSTGFTSDDVIEVAKRGAASAVTYDANVLLSGPLKLFDPLMQVGFKRVAAKAAQGLGEALASPS